MSKVYSLFLAGALLMMSCQSLMSPSGAAKVRVTAQATGEDLNVRVVLEGADGNSLSGALVHLTDPGNGVTFLSYDDRQSAYVLNTEAVDGTYTVGLESQSAGQKMVSFPVMQLQTPPDVIQLQDGLGNSALDFKRLKVSTPFRVEWTPTAQADRYLLEARQFGRTIWSKAISGASSAVIPANTFTSTSTTTGSQATVLVTASKTSGDPYFKKVNYLSSSTLNGSSFSFIVVP